MSFSVIIPVYNEQRIIENNTKKLIKFLNSLREPYEIIIADNGSTDKTLEKGRNLERQLKNVKFITIQKKGAVGWAFRKAVLASKYNNIVSLDMDLSVNLSFVPECLNLLKENSLVIGSKLSGSQDRSILRRLASFVFIMMTRVVLRLRFNDYSMAAKGYRKSDIIKHVNKVDKGSAYVIQLIFYTKKKGKKIKEIPVKCLDKRKGKFGFVDEVIYRFRSLITIRLRDIL